MKQGIPAMMRLMLIATLLICGPAVNIAHAQAAATPTATPAPTPIATPDPELKDDPSVHMIAVEALVVEVNEERTRELGLTYGGNQTGAGGAPVLGPGVFLGGKANLGPNFPPVNVPALIPGVGGENQVAFISRLPGLGISLTGMNVGTAAISAKLRALLNEGDATIRTRPVAVALNHTPVRIETVNEVPVQSVVGPGQLNVEFRKVGVLMEVTPEIVTLRPGIASLSVTKLEVSSISSLVTNKNIDRPVFSRSAAQQTKITLAEGETFLFGGLKTRRTEHFEDQVPILHHIPLLGMLFRSRTEVERNMDVLFFITPYILAPGENFLVPFDFKNHQALGLRSTMGS